MKQIKASDEVRTKLGLPVNDGKFYNVMMWSPPGAQWLQVQATEAGGTELLVNEVRHWDGTVSKPGDERWPHGTI